METTLKYQDLLTADEIFSSGNYSKVVPVTRIGERPLEFGPFYKKARELYWEFAHSKRANFVVNPDTAERALKTSA